MPKIMSGVTENGKYQNKRHRGGGKRPSPLRRYGLKEQIYGKYPDCDLISADIFMGRLVDLIIEEQLFCKAVGNSGGLLLSINDGYHGIHIDLPREYGGLSDEEILKKEAELIYNSRKMLLLQSEGGIHKIKIYRKTEEFCVGSPIMLDAIREN